MLLTSMRLRHCPRCQQLPLCLGLGPQPDGSNILADRLIFPPPLTTLDVFMCLMIAAIVDIPLDLWATTDWCWFSFQHIPYVFSLVYDCMLFFLWCVSVSCDSQTLLESLSKRSICCVLRPHPCWVVAGHTQAPASSIFTLWFFSLTTILVPGQRAPLTTPKEEGEHT